MKNELSQKDIVEEIYKRISAMNWKSYLVCFGTFIGLMILVSLFLGNPFPHKQSIIFTEIWVEGWIVEKPTILFLLAIQTFCAILGWEIKETYTAFKPLKDMILEECDPLKVISITERGIAYPVKSRFVRNVALPQFEQLHVEALNAAGEFDAALTYLKEQWRTKRTNYSNVLMVQIELNKAVVLENQEQYQMLYEHAPKALKNKPITQAQKCIMEKNYAQAISILDKMKYKYFVYKVQVMYFYGKCYFEMQEYAQAENHLQYVVENGNTLVYQKEAVEMLEKIQK